MRQKTKRSCTLGAPTIYLFVYVVIILLVILMILPLSAALSAGIAALSVVIFGLSIIASLALWIVRPRQERKYIAAALIAALFGLLAPQLAFMITAQKHGVDLTFNPISYLTFSGKSTITPTKLIAYKSDNGRPMNLAYYESKQAGERPAVLLLHGGGWRYGNYLEIGLWPETLTEAGFDVFSVEYRLSNDTYPTWRDAPSDVHEAMNYVKNNASELSIDAANINLMGQSAGGHLALLEAYLHNEAASVVSLYAPIDLVLDFQTSRDKSAELDFIGGPPSQYLTRYRAVSPMTYVSAQAPRTLLLQGTTDDIVAPQNATRLSNILTDKRIEHAVVYLPATGHSFENQRGGFATQIAKDRVVRFLSQ